MKKLNQAGVAALYAILAVLIIGAAGFFAYTRVRDNKKDTPTSTTAQDNDKSSDLVTELDVDNPVEMFDKGDTDKLPASVPASFKTYMEELLADNKPIAGGGDAMCVTLYSVLKISSVNISGGIGPVDATSHEAGTDGCGGGAGAYYYLKDGKWDVLHLQAAIGCDELDKTTLYSEFVPSCYDEGTDAPKDNPNGSIQDADL